jgi:hypothetical protein
MVLPAAEPNFISICPPRMEFSRDSGFASGKNRSDALIGTETFQTPGSAFFTVGFGQGQGYLTMVNVQKLKEII